MHADKGDIILFEIPSTNMYYKMIMYKPCVCCQENGTLDLVVVKDLLFCKYLFLYIKRSLSG